MMPALLLSAAGRAAGAAAGYAVTGAGGKGLGSTRRRFAAVATSSASTSAPSFSQILIPFLKIYQDDDYLIIIVAAARVFDFI
jgi:hypothetical protein